MKALLVAVLVVLPGCAVLMEPPCVHFEDSELSFYTGDDTWDRAACRRVRDQQDPPEPDGRPDPSPPEIVSPVEEPPNEEPEA